MTAIFSFGAPDRLRLPLRVDVANGFNHAVNSLSLGKKLTSHERGCYELVTNIINTIQVAADSSAIDKSTDSIYLKLVKE